VKKSDDFQSSAPLNCARQSALGNLIIDQSEGGVQGLALTWQFIFIELA
jgi:hypothetical protein